MIANVHPSATSVRITFGIAALMVGLLLLPAPASAEDGVTADKIVLGQAAPLDGPASALGLDMKQGLLAAFDEANRGGG